MNDDTISRRMAINALESIGSIDTEADKEYARSVFEALPSAQPERKKGKWILECDAEGEGDNLYRCSECGQRYGCQEYDLPNFCSHCGCQMKGADNE